MNQKPDNHNDFNERLSFAIERALDAASACGILPGEAITPRNMPEFQLIEALLNAGAEVDDCYPIFGDETKPAVVGPIDQFLKRRWGDFLHPDADIRVECMTREILITLVSHGWNMPEDLPHDNALNKSFIIKGHTIQHEGEARRLERDTAPALATGDARALRL